tara:strand:- start:249 stop:497 length:249 start_codon:yes stop_codon:yes gene_type:complete
MNSFQFSQDQRNAVNGICNQLLDPNTKSHVLTVLTGSAGTGKTTVVGEIINKINQQSPLTSVALAQLLIEQLLYYKILRGNR